MTELDRYHTFASCKRTRETSANITEFVFKQLHLNVLKTYMYFTFRQDNLGSWQKCVSACKDALSRGKSVVIDNTSPTTEVRKR